MARFRRILKWTGIIIGSLVGLFILLIVLVAVFAGDDNGSRANTPAERPTSVPVAANTPVAPGPTATRRPTATPRPTPTFEEKKALATRIPYDDLFRNNEEHIGKRVSYMGEVIQVVGGDEDLYNLRANVSKGEYLWDDTVYLYYSGPRVLEGDIIEFIGVVQELITYESIFGQKITIPAIEITALQVVAKAGSPNPTPTPRIPPTAVATNTWPTATLAPTQTATPTSTPTPIPLGMTLDNPIAAGEVLQ